MTNPEHIAAQSRETTVCGRVEKFCKMAGLTLSQALHSAMPELEDAELQEILNRLTTLDQLPEHAVHSIARYFRVGAAEIDPEIAEIIRSRLVYLAGPITAKAGSFDTFKIAQDYLESLGYCIVNPSAASSTLPEHALTRQDFMDFGLSMLKMCRGIALLPGWQNSTGAKLERAYAQANGYNIMYIYPEDLNRFTNGGDTVASSPRLNDFRITISFSGTGVMADYGDNADNEYYDVSSVEDIYKVVAEVVRSAMFNSSAAPIVELPTANPDGMNRFEITICFDGEYVAVSYNDGSDMERYRANDIDGVAAVVSEALRTGLSDEESDEPDGEPEEFETPDEPAEESEQDAEDEN